MPPLQIMVIRHGEKPAQQPPPYGVDPNGQTDPHALSVVGWQRAGALVDFFSFPRETIQQPTYLYSPPDEGGDEGGRPYETINPLSAKLGLTQNTTFSVGQQTQLVPDMMTSHRRLARLRAPSCPSRTGAAIAQEAELSAHELSAQGG
ncbi:MAG: hypothetical protein JO352_25565 [Chloroflexi bacterium]|nr:hypothetical protein [Chloroflexota bacterium]MBV9596903.1 hypothetical protein [Chloroflexota bacterium]